MSLKHGHNCPCDKCNPVHDRLTCRHDQGTTWDTRNGSLHCAICGEYLCDAADMEQWNHEELLSHHKER